MGIRGEPPTLPLLAALRARGVRVLLPLLRDDLDLEWADYDGDPARLVRGPRGVLHPPGPSLGLDGIAEAALVLAPALAVDAAGRRLGQGGGSYDRALTRTSAPVLAVVFDDELLESVPVQAHDRPVGGTLTPAGGVRTFSSVVELAQPVEREALRIERVGAHADVGARLDAAGVHLRRELAHARRVVAAVLEGDLELDVEHRLGIDPDTGVDDRGDARHALARRSAATMPWPAALAATRTPRWRRAGWSCPW